MLVRECLATLSGTVMMAKQSTTKDKPISLEDKYVLPKGTVYMSGIQALVRLPMLQKVRDELNGLSTGGFISGYRGSPLGGYDQALVSAAKWLKEKNVHFEPGLNEDLAATAVWGSQQLNLFPGAKVDGVFGIWYGKGPGADRCGDVFKHANGAGTAVNGGVLAIVGDDHGCHSSTMPHQSEQTLIAAMMPVVAPATLQEYLDFGLMGFALSRYSGCWVGIKAVAQTIETSGTVEIDPARPSITLPPGPDGLREGLNIRLTDPALEQEKRLHGPRMDAVAAFARANRFDEVVWNPPQAKIGIAAAGKAYLDLREALRELGIDEAAADRLGLRLYKIGLVWPLEQEGIKVFAEGLDEIVVVEEKRSVVEDQIAKILYNAPRRPRVVGKRDEGGSVLFPSEGEIDPVLVARAIGSRLMTLERDASVVQNLARLEQLSTVAGESVPTVSRAPFFCSGCPHNTSTQLPEGSRGMAGIGCHGMITFMPERRTHLWSHMGGEGLAWVGQAPFSSETHVFQNLGDGTYSHSGLLAIRAAAASKVNITYKILFNDAVAMTGGQPVEGGLTVPQLCRQVAAEGAKKIVIVAEDTEKYTSGTMAIPPGIDVHPRDDLDAVQRDLRETEGLSILIYDQVCAAEKRRRRKRTTYPDPDRRIFINEMVCENCGDCTIKSNCISVQPTDTDFGRKRRIDQSSCNKDFSCVKGFCPSFVSVSGAKVRKSGLPGAARGVDAAEFPEPNPVSIGDVYNVLVTGIGGTGVITVGALLGMAARLDDKHCTVLDSTGMAQKNGAVTSHVRIWSDKDSLASKIPAGRADLVLACDMVVASSPSAFPTIRRDVTRIVANAEVTPTAAFVRDRDFDMQETLIEKRLRNAAGPSMVDIVPAQRIATALFGDSIATNTFMLGYAFQKGLLPVSLRSLLRAIELNAVGVALNKQAFNWGRSAALDLPAVAEAASLKKKASIPTTTDEIIEHRARHLTEYQNAAYADRYRRLVEEVRKAEAAVLPGSSDLTKAVALNMAKLMAYKDEYEVARLYTSGDFQRGLQRQFEGDIRVSVHMAPPFLSRRNAAGEPVKRTFGPWIWPMLRTLSKFKRVRGTVLDPFGRTEERRIERQLVEDYEREMRQLLQRLSKVNHSKFVKIASVPDMIRGFGQIKLQSVALAKRRHDALLDESSGQMDVPMAAE